MQNVVQGVQNAALIRKIRGYSAALNSAMRQGKPRRQGDGMKIAMRFPTFRRMDFHGYPLADINPQSINP